MNLFVILFEFFIRKLAMSFPSTAKVLILFSKLLITCAKKMICKFEEYVAPSWKKVNPIDLKTSYYELLVFYAIFITFLVHSLNRLPKKIEFAKVILPSLLHLTKQIEKLMVSLSSFPEKTCTSNLTESTGKTFTTNTNSESSVRFQSLGSLKQSNVRQRASTSTSLSPSITAQNCPSPLSLPLSTISISPEVAVTTVPITHSIHKENEFSFGQSSPMLKSENLSKNIQRAPHSDVIRNVKPPNEPAVEMSNFFSPNSFYSCHLSLLSSDLIQVSKIYKYDFKPF
jgi:hypothetical protein